MNDQYSEHRRKQADRYDPEINRIISQFISEKDNININDITIQDTEGTLDYQGIDKIVNDTYKFQVKTILYDNFDTVTIPIADYEKYKTIDNLYVLHSYYNIDSPTLRQYVLFKYSDLLQYESIRRKRKRGVGAYSRVEDTSTGTDFYYWNYDRIKEIFLVQYNNPGNIPDDYAFIDFDEE